MANTYKNIIITPNIGNTADPKIQFLGGNTTANTDVNLFVYPDSNGTVSFEGSAGQLFSITNDLSNSLFAVSDVSGIPSLEVFANGLVSVIPFSGNVVFGNSSVNVLVNSTAVVGNTVGTHTGAVVLGTSSLSANGGVGTAGQVLHSNGTATYWAADDNAGGTVTSVASGNGITGGTITGAGTLSAVAGTGTVVNATGIHVNATYIGTLSANNTTYVNGKTEGNLNVNNATTAYGKTEGNLNVNNATTAYGKTEGNLNVNAAAQLTTTRTINGVNFNGTANILVPSLYDANYRRITNPGGAEYTTTAATLSGALQIILPVGPTNSMMRMTVKIYEYDTNKSFDVICGGYFYNPGTGSSWINTFAYILGDKDVDRRFTVRFGLNAASKGVIYIGELASTWAYPQVFVTEVELGYGGQSATWVSGWSIGFQASAFEGVTATVTSTQVGYGTSTSTADALVLRDASSNFSANLISSSLAAATDQGIINQNNGNATTWYGRILSKNSTNDRAAFLGTFGSIAGVFAHNNALNAWATLYVNNVDGVSGGLVQTPNTVSIGSASYFVANGNFGVGTNAPAHKLSVSGTTNLAGAVTGITTLAAGNTTITGFVNATSSVNAASYTVATNFIANTSGVYSTGTVNAAVVSSTNATFTRVTDIYQGAGDIRNNLGNPSVEEKALFHGQMNNKFRFIAPTSQEESTDNVTWTASTRATTAQLGDLMVGEGQGTSFIAIPSGTVGTAGYYRLTWDVFGTTNYIFLNHLYIYCETQALTTTFTVEAFNNATSTWDSIASGTGANWPGHVSIKHNTIPYNSSTSAGFYGKVRVTFAVPSRNNTNVVYLSAIEWFGGYPSAKRNVESYDRFKNVTFPANLAAVSISGNLTGNVIATTISGNLTGNTAGIHTGAVVLGTSSLSANGGLGTAGQVLHSNGTATYWAADDTGGTVTSVATGNGLTGGTITTTGTLSAVAGTGTVVNATGIHVNASYIATITANNSTFMNGNTVVSVMESLRANRNISGGGTITVDASYNVLWSARFIIISNGRGAHFATQGYFDITCPTSGTITGAGGAANKTATAAGVPLGVWEALYYILPLGGVSTPLAANFRVVSYTADVEIPSDWVLICVRNGDTGQIHFNNGITLTASQSYNTVSFNSAIAPTANNSSFLAGYTFAAPSVLGATTANGASLTYANVSGQVNTATLYATTSANIASAVQANATGVWTTGTVNGAVHSIGTTFIANTLGVYHTGTINAASHTVGTAFTANATVVNAVSYYSGTLLIANTTVINATHLAGTAAAGYQTTAGLSANVATLTSNNSTYLGGYTFAAPSVLGATTANGASLTYANVSGQVNTATLYATTSANIASVVQANAIGVYVGANVITNTSALFIGNTTINTIYGQFGASVTDGIAGVSAAYDTTLYMSDSTLGVTNIQPTSVVMTDLGATPNTGSFGPSMVSIGNSSIVAYLQPGTLSISSGAYNANLAAATLTMSIGGSVTTVNATVVNTSTVNAASHTIGTTLVANATGVYHTGTVNAASYTVGTSTVANATGVYTGIVNAASHTVGTAFTANATVVNAVSYYAGSLLVANTTVINATHLAGVATSGYARRGGGLGSIDYNVQRTLASGFYSVDASPTNGPPSGSYSNFIQMYERGDTGAQIVVDYANGQLYSRGILTSTPTYSAWRTYLSNTANLNISGGFSVTSYPATTGNIALNPLLGNYQYITNNGNFTITAPTVDCAIDLLIINGATPATLVTFTGFQPGPTGGTISTTTGHEFIVSIRRINSMSTYSIYAMQ